MVRTDEDDARLQLGGEAEDGGDVLVAVAEVHVHHRRRAHVEEREGALLGQRLRMLLLCRSSPTQPQAISHSVHVCQQRQPLPSTQLAGTTVAIRRNALQEVTCSCITHTGLHSFQFCQPRDKCYCRGRPHMLRTGYKHRLSSHLGLQTAAKALRLPLPLHLGQHGLPGAGRPMQQHPSRQPQQVVGLPRLLLERLDDPRPLRTAASTISFLFNTLGRAQPTVTLISMHKLHVLGSACTS